MIIFSILYDYIYYKIWFDDHYMIIFTIVLTHIRLKLSSITTDNHNNDDDDDGVIINQ